MKFKAASAFAISILCAALGLTACGGGGGGGGANTAGLTATANPLLGTAPTSTIAPPTTTVSGQPSATTTATTTVSGKAEGAYEGTTNNNQIFQALILENDEGYVLYGQQVNGLILLQGFIHATNGKSQNGTYTANVSDFYKSGQIYKGAVAGTYKPGESIMGTVITNATTTTFTGTAVPTANYNYDTPALLSTVVGTWSGGTLLGDSGSITIKDAGSFSGILSGCSLNGQLTPRASKKNVFDMTLTFGPAPCLLPNGSASGGAVVRHSTTGGTQLIVAGESTTGIGTAFVATR